MLAFTIGLALLAFTTAVQAQWVAYNDHNRGVGTASFVSTYSLTKSGTTNMPAGGPLTNFATGLTITNAIGVVGVSISATGSVDSTTVPTISPSNSSPAGQLFNGKIDWNLSSIQFGNLAAWSTSSVTIAFTNLTPGRQYKFRGTGGRGLTYSNRWTLATLAGASNATHAHLLATNSPGIVTNGWSPYGDKLNPKFQALWNSGVNICGDVIGWDNIVPINNSFSVISSNWTLPVPSPISGTNSASLFAFAAFSLEEVFQPMAIVAQPQDTVACPGATISFSVGVTGDQPGYQWRSVNGGVTNLIDGATNATLVVSNAADSGAYFVVVTNSLNALTSTLAHVSVGSGGIEILAQPQHQTNVAGTTASFVLMLSTNTSRPISLLWYYSPGADDLSLANPIPGATELSLSLTNVSTNQVGYYYAVLTNCVGVATSQVASLNVYYLPVQILTQPQSATLMQSGNVILSVGVGGTPPISYQWYKGDMLLPGQTKATLVLSNLQYVDSGYYHVVAANPAPSSVTSSNALLIVNVPPYNLMPINNYVWKYNQSGSDLGTDWTAPNYDDSAWPSGRSLLGHCTSNYSGFANNPRLFTNTDLNLINGGTTNITYYFRTLFVLSNDPSIVQLTTSNFYAHGLVVYLNGTEAYRMNMPSGKINYQTFASSAYTPVNDPLVGVFWPTNIPMALSSSLLVQGTNTLAVECHKYSLSSPDFYMGVSLTISFPTPIPLQITNQPQNVTVDELRPASFSIGCAATAPRFQWYKQGINGLVPVPGATAQTLTLARPIAGKDDGSYSVVVSNLLGQIMSDSATLTITQAAPTIVSQPTSQTVCPGWPALFQAASYGSATSTYQWRVDGAEISQATNSSYFIPSAAPQDAGTYSVFVSNALGSATSSNASLVVLPGSYPILATQPSNQVGNLGETVRFSVTTVSNDLCFGNSYQWQFNEADIPRANSTELNLTNLQAVDEGFYRVVVSDATGSVTSTVAELTVNLATLDGGFNPGANGAVYALMPQTDGKLLLGGTFFTLGGQPRYCLGRLNVDGTLDRSFNPGALNAVYAMAVQTDGKILVSGNFNTLGGQPRSNLGRLNSDGTLDTGFNPGADAVVYALALQPDGKILVGGYFHSIGGQPLTNVARLNTDGSPDSTFNPGVSGHSSYVLGLTVQLDGKILMGGNFVALGGQPRTNIARLNRDSTLDTSFDPGANDLVRAIVLQPDNKILVGGAFTMLGGQPRDSIARLTPDGTVDGEFNPGANSTVRSISVQADGKILVQGYFTTLGGQPRNYLGRLNRDGTLDRGFNPGADAMLSALTLAPNGQILVGGNFTVLGGHSCDYLGRLNNTEPATQNLAYEDSTITWLRGGTSPEVWRTTFEQSTDGASWTSLGAGLRIPGGWQLPGITLRPGTAIRARGYVTSSYHNGSSWFVESLLQPPSVAILTGDGGFGIVSNRFGFNIQGSGAQVVVEASTDLRNWTAVSTNALSGGIFYFNDPEWTAMPQRFYRARLWP